jgi:hypothetical protein
MTTIQYAKGAVRPDLSLWVYDDDGELIDFSTGFTFTVRIGDRGKPAVKQKTTGIVGAAGSGSEDDDDGVPNLRIQWAAGDLDVTPGEYTIQINADAGGGTTPRYFFRDIEIIDIVLAP